MIIDLTCHNDITHSKSLS